jgi:hypothetical protein
MSESTAQALGYWLAGYGLVGVLFGLAFVARGAATLDPAARDAGWGFRLLLLPALAAFWPLLAWRWLASARRPS